MLDVGRVAAYESDVPFESERIGAAAVYCSDGRYGDQMDEFLHHGLGLPRYDRVAVPGGAGCLASYSTSVREEGALEKQLRFLIESHELSRVVLIAHQDCGFYKHLRLRQPLETQQFQDLEKVARRIRTFSRWIKVDAFFARRAEGKVRFEAVG